MTSAKERYEYYLELSKKENKEEKPNKKEYI